MKKRDNYWIFSVSGSYKETETKERDTFNFCFTSEHPDVFELDAALSFAACCGVFLADPIEVFPYAESFICAQRIDKKSFETYTRHLVDREDLAFPETLSFQEISFIEKALLEFLEKGTYTEKKELYSSFTKDSLKLKAVGDFLEFLK